MRRHYFHFIIFENLRIQTHTLPKILLLTFRKVQGCYWKYFRPLSTFGKAPLFHLQIFRVPYWWILVDFLYVIFHIM